MSKTPETLLLQEEAGQIAIQALETVLKRERLSNDTISHEVLSNGLVEFTIKPTRVGFLYDWFTECGKQFEKAGF